MKKSDLVLLPLVSLFALVTLSNCKKTLDENPVSFFSETSLFESPEGADAAINGIISQYASGEHYGNAFHNIVVPASGKFYSSQQANIDATGLNCNPNNPNLNDYWAGAYRTIHAANIAIKNLEASQLANKNTLLGYAYFFRGATYLNLVRLFGGVPLRTKPTDLETLHLPRANRQEVIDLIIADLDKAKTLMPAPAQTTNGRPAKYAANMMLAKLYMTLAGEDNGQAAFWAKANNELLAIESANAYKLNPTFAGIFDLTNENGIESIFELQYGHTGGTRTSDAPRLYMPPATTLLPPQITTFGRLRPNKETFDSHTTQYPADPRIEATFLYGQFTRHGQPPVKIYPDKKNSPQGFPFMRKHFDVSYNGTTTNRNMIVLRYADVLLMLAEVENELNGPEEAYKYVNRVIARARDTNGDGTSDAAQPADYAGLSKDQFRTRILKERQYELLGEGHEWFDTRRRGFNYFLAEVVTAHNTSINFDQSTDYTYPDLPKNMLLPIPLSELAGNEAIDESNQNPGY